MAYGCATGCKDCSAALVRNVVRKIQQETANGFSTQLCFQWTQESADNHGEVVVPELAAHIRVKDWAWFTSLYNVFDMVEKLR